MAYLSSISPSNLFGLKANREKLSTRIIAIGGLVFKGNINLAVTFHDYLSSITIEGFTQFRISIFEDPLSAELSYCPESSRQSFLSKRSMPAYQINVQHGAKCSKSDLVFDIKTLRRTRKIVDEAFINALQNNLKSGIALNYSWVSRR